MSKAQLTELGVKEQDVIDLYRGIQQLHSIVFAVRALSACSVVRGHRPPLPCDFANVFVWVRPRCG